jgi:hypothetical protein
MVRDPHAHALAQRLRACLDEVHEG